MVADSTALKMSHILRRHSISTLLLAIKISLEKYIKISLDLSFKMNRDYSIKEHYCSPVLGPANAFRLVCTAAAAARQRKEKGALFLADPH